MGHPESPVGAGIGLLLPKITGIPSLRGDGERTAIPLRWSCPGIAVRHTSQQFGIFLSEFERYSFERVRRSERS